VSLVLSLSKEHNIMIVIVQSFQVVDGKVDASRTAPTSVLKAGTQSESLIIYM